MKNGDHLTCEIKGLNGGVLYVGLPYVIQTLSVDWSKVDHLESKQMFPHISDLNSVVESSDRRFHQYPCGFESDDYAPEVNTQWVKAPNSLFSFPSTPLSRSSSKVRESLPTAA